jgi:hypothetical protein
MRYPFLSVNVQERDFTLARFVPKEAIFGLWGRGNCSKILSLHLRLNRAVM